MAGASKVRLGFVGVGRMGQMAHLRNYACIDDCEVVAVADPRQETARRVAQRYGIAKTYAGHREMLAAEQLDGVVASQPFQSHAALLAELYPACRFLFTEKPLAVDVQAGRSLARRAADAGCVHMVGYNKRSDPATAAAVATIRAWQADGSMGPLKYVRILMPPGDWAADGFAELIDAGDKPPAGSLVPAESPPAGTSPEAWKRLITFVNYYIHQVNLMRHLLGEPYEVAWADPGGVVLGVRSRSGVSGTIEMSPYRTTLGWEESALVAFEKGYVRLALPAPMTRNRAGTVEVYSDPGNGVRPTRTSPVLPPIDSMRQQAINFVKVCRGEMAPPCEAAEAAEDLAIAADYLRRLEGAGQ